MFESKSEAAWWLSGFIDGEGSVSYREDGKYARWPTRMLRVTNTDPALIEAAVAAFHVLGVEAKVKVRRVPEGRKPAWDVAVSSESAFRILASELRLQSPKKRRELARLVASYTPRVGARGATSPRAVLTDTDVLALRQQAAEGLRFDVLASSYGISASHASRIAHGVQWGHVGGPRSRRRPNGKMRHVVEVLQGDEWVQSGTVHV